MQDIPKPEWIKARGLSEKSYQEITSVSNKYNLHTICQEANCPNINECWSANTATFLILGEICTRNCRFCSVATGNPDGLIDIDEPVNVAKAVKELKLKYIVLTSVDRDDLNDGGSKHFAVTISEIKKISPDIRVEALIPDFNGDLELLETVIKAKPDVIGHNIETVERLTPKIRDKKASYRTSLKVLKSIKEINKNILTKSSIQVGFGESYYDIDRTLIDLKDNNTDIVTIGQYLRPTVKQVPVAEYIHPNLFTEYRKLAESLGFLYVVSTPFARSSYKAAESYVLFLNNSNG